MARRIEVEILGNANSLNRAFNSSRRSAGIWNSEIVRSGRGAFAATVGFGGLGRAVAFASAQFIAFASIATVIKNTTAATVEFNDTMQKTVGLAQVSQNAVAGLSDELLDLAPKVGKGPNELAKALYFVASAGIDASNAMKVVEVSAKAASAGLGDTQTVADALTSAINAYGQANLSAAKAADVFVSTVRLGKGEADAFAPSLGNVANVAAALGVQFADLGGSLAAITRLGVEPQTAAIELQQAFASLLKTTPQATKAFKSVGLSVEELKKTLRGPQGMIGFLTTLRQHFAGNTDELARAFPNMRAFRGILALIGKQFPQVIDVLEKARHTTGSLGTAFRAVAHDSAFRFAQMRAAVEALGITVGDIFAPLATKIAEAITPAAERFRNFIKEIGKQRTFTAKINFVVTGLEKLTVNLAKRIASAIGGPGAGVAVARDFTQFFNQINDAAERLYEGLHANFGKIRATIASAFQALQAITQPLAQIIGGTLVVAFKTFQAVLPPVLSLIRGLAEVLSSRVGRAFTAGAIAIGIAVVAYRRFIIAVTAIRTAALAAVVTLRTLGATAAATAGIVQASNAKAVSNIAMYTGAQKAATTATAATGTAVTKLNPILAGLSVAVGLAVVAYTFFGRSTDQLAEAQKRLSDALHGVATSTRDLREAQLDVRQAQLSQRQANLDVLTTFRRMVAVQRNGKASTAEIRQAVLDYQQALLGQKRAQQDVTNAQNRAIAKAREQAGSFSNLQNKTKDVGDQFKAIIETQRRLRAVADDPVQGRAQIAARNQLPKLRSQLRDVLGSYVRLARGAQAWADANRKLQPALAGIAQTIANQARARVNFIRNLLGLPPAIDQVGVRSKAAAERLVHSIATALASGRPVSALMGKLGQLPANIDNLVPPTAKASRKLANALSVAIVKAAQVAVAALAVYQKAVEQLGPKGPAFQSTLTALQRRAAEAQKQLKALQDKFAKSQKSGTTPPKPGKDDSPDKVAKSFELPIALRVREARAALTKTMRDDIRVWQAEVAFILKQLPRLHGERLVEALQQLKQIRDEIAGAVKKAHKSVVDQFTVPLRIQLAEARAQAQGDDKAFRRALIAARRAARKALASGKLSIQAQIDAWNTIADINNQLADANKDQTGNQTKFRHLGERAQLAALGLEGLTGLAREQAAFFRAQIGPNGSIPGRSSPAFSGAGAGQQNYVINGGVNIYAPKNWREIEEELRRRSRQRHHSRRS